MQKRKLSQVGVEAVERLNLPPEAAMGVPQVELYGNRQLYMAGHRGVISYSTEEVAVSGGSMTVRITGRDLQLAAMTEGELRLTGHIDRVELME
jgi:sporulation protein YqfC